MAARAMRIEGCSDLHWAKLLAAREGHSFAWDVGFRQIILEGDAQNVYNNIESSKEDL